ncbi:MAG: hypothetical protein ABH829_01465 [archaeon]
MGLFSKELYDKKDLKLIERYPVINEKEFIQISCIPRVNYGQMVKDSTPLNKLDRLCTYTTLLLVEGIDHGGKSYVGHLFHRGTANAMRYLRDNVPADFLYKYTIGIKATTEVERGNIVEADDAKLRISQLAIKDLPYDYKLKYMLIEHGTPLVKYLQKQSSSVEEVYYKIGALLAEMQKAGFVQAGFGPHNMVMLGQDLKIIHLYDPNLADCQSTLIKIKDLKEAEHSDHIINAMGAMFCKPLMEEFGFDDRHLRLHLIKEMEKGYTSVNRNRYEDFTLNLIAYR